MRIDTVSLLVSLFFSGEVLLAEEKKTNVCEMQVVSVKNDANTYTLVLKHKQECEILMDDNKSLISLVSKHYEHSIGAGSDSNLTLSSSKVDTLIGLAKSKLGDSYVYAQAGPEHFDCSGFVYYVFKTKGITIPRTSLLQSQSGEKIKRSNLKRGDILSFDTHDRKHINHSGIYLGEGKFIHSSSGKAYGVTISDLDKGFYKDKFRWGVRKIEE